MMRRMKWHMLLLLALLLNSCALNKAEEEARKWLVTLQHKDKNPYGSYLAYESLKYFFPSAHVSPLSAGFRFDDMSGDMTYSDNSGRKLLVLSGFIFHLSEREWDQIKQFVSYGNEVVIFTNTLDKKIEHELKVRKYLSEYESYTNTSSKKNLAYERVLSIAGKPAKKYGYKGHAVKGFFRVQPTDTMKANDAAGLPAPVSGSNEHERADSSQTDTVVDADNYYEQETTASSDDDYSSDATTSEYSWPAPDTLGYVTDSLPNMLRFSTGEGHITLHAAPLALSNYFLLQTGNEQYLSEIWHTLPGDINQIYWCEFDERYEDVSSRDILWRYAATKLAILLALFVLLVYVLFEGKRRQRIIPIIPAIKNDSVSFVETVGRLYYNKGNHTNLADKMIQQYLEWVRTVYLLNTNILNEQFIEQLTVKSGQPEAIMRGLMEMIHEVRMRTGYIDDAYLYQLYNTIQQFYKNRRI